MTRGQGEIVQRTSKLKFQIEKQTLRQIIVNINENLANEHRQWKKTHNNCFRIKQHYTKFHHAEMNKSDCGKIVVMLNNKQNSMI